MGYKNYLELTVEKLDIKDNIVNKLKLNNIFFIKDIWCLKRKNLKDLDLNDSEINKIIIQLQLNGIDLNKKVY
ncbi:MAG: hypothetical protein J6A52_04620 [Bacilli bacterium]|nr:hypothetical protein [Bacilli bacterium]